MTQMEQVKQFFISNAGQEIRPQDIVQSLEVKWGYACFLCAKFCLKGFIERIGKGRYVYQGSSPQ